jgi:CRISPR-associated protein Cmr3
MSGWIFLRPIDGWSFRDGKPFDVGEAFEASSIFPPLPWTIAGAIRTALLHRVCPEIDRYAARAMGTPCNACGDGTCVAEDRVGKAGAPPPFDIGPPLPARLLSTGKVEAYYPTPKDLVWESTNDHGLCPRILGPLEMPEGVTCSSKNLQPIAIKTHGRLMSWPEPYVETEDLSAYLNSVLPDANNRVPKIYFEPRIGVAIEGSTRSAARGRLYIRDVIRLEESEQGSGGLLVRTGIAGELVDSLGRLGGDGRMVSFHRVDKDPDTPRYPNEVKDRFKIYFASPAFFTRGWIPGWLNEQSLEGSIPGTDLHVKMVGACISESLPAGGWDLAAQQPREMRRLLGAGSVLYFRILSGSSDELRHAVHNHMIGDNESMTKTGFGLAFVGRY